MDVQTLVQSWIQWSEQHLPLSGDIPKINSKEPKPPWIDNFSDTFTAASHEGERLLNCFMHRLIAEPNDKPARFTALAVYYALSGQDWERAEEILVCIAGEEGYHPQELEMGRSGDFTEYEEAAKECETQANRLMKGFSGDLGLLVRAVKAEEIPFDWAVIRWEILNSYAVSDWKRALKLYNIAEEANLLDLGDLQFARAQFRYLLVFGAAIEVGLESLWWEPAILALEDSNSALLLLMSGLRLREFKTELTESSIDTLRDAANDLEKALQKRPKLSRLYGPILARCYFSTGRLRDAAAIYEQSLTEWAVDVIRQWIYESLKFVYQESQLPEKTKELLERWAAEFPADMGIRMQIAELQTQLMNSEAVPINSRRELDLSPDVSRVWNISYWLVLNETRNVSQEIQSELKSDEKYVLRTALVEEYWPSFTALSSSAQNQWINGICLRDDPVSEPLRAVRRGNAGLAFAIAVELELNSRVFSRFRESVLAARSVKELAGVPIDQKGELRVILPYVRKDRPYDKKSLTLGVMKYLIDICKRSQEFILQELKTWIEGNCSRLLAQTKDLNKVAEFRNKPAHGNTPEIPSESIPSLCRKIIDSLA